MGAREEFLAGDRPDDVALFLADPFLDDVDSLADLDAGERVESDDGADGTVLVVDGDSGRSVFKRLTGMDAMGFARRASGTESRVGRDLTGGDCPDADGGDHHASFVFAFAEAQNEEVGGLYAEGDVVHAYAYCDCGTAYSDRWVAGEAGDV